MKQYKVAIPKQGEIEIKLGGRCNTHTKDEKIRLLRILEKYGFVYSDKEN